MPSFIQIEKFVLPPPVAEHGFSALITIPKSEQGTSISFLFDTRVSERGVCNENGEQWFPFQEHRTKY
jgi:hypothetical protein